MQILGSGQAISRCSLFFKAGRFCFAPGFQRQRKLLPLISRSRRFWRRTPSTSRILSTSWWNYVGGNRLRAGAAPAEGNVGGNYILFLGNFSKITLCGDFKNSEHELLLFPGDLVRAAKQDLLARAVKRRRRRWRRARERFVTNHRRCNRDGTVIHATYDEGAPPRTRGT